MISTQSDRESCSKKDNETPDTSGITEDTDKENAREIEATSLASQEMMRNQGKGAVHHCHHFHS